MICEMMKADHLPDLCSYYTGILPSTPVSCFVVSHYSKKWMHQFPANRTDTFQYAPFEKAFFLFFSLTFSTSVSNSIHSSMVLWSQMILRALFSVLLVISSCELPQATLKFVQYLATRSFNSSSARPKCDLFSSAALSSFTEYEFVQSI